MAAADCCGFWYNQGTIRNPPWESTAPWNGIGTETRDYLMTTAGLENGVLKIIRYALDWFQFFNPLAFSEEMTNVRDEFGAMKDGIAVAKIPGQVVKITGSIGKMANTPSCWNCCSIFTDVLGLTSPVFDTAKFVNSRVMDLPAGPLAALGHINAGALTIVMGHLSIFECFKISDVIGDACGAQQLDTEAVQTQILLSMITLAKTISYLVMAVLFLVSAFVVTIPALSFYVMFLATTGTVATVVEHFAKRFFDSGLEYRGGYLPEC